MDFVVASLDREGDNLKTGGNLPWAKWLLLSLVVLGSVLAVGQQDQQKPAQNIPDAPSATRPAQPLPSVPPVPAQQAPETTAPPAANSPANEPPPSEPPPPMPEIKTVPEGGATPSPPSSDSQEQLFTLTAHV